MLFSFIIVIMIETRWIAMSRQILSVNMVEFILAHVFTPPSGIETKDAPILAHLVGFSLRSAFHGHGERNFAALQRQAIPFVVLVKHGNFSTALGKVSHNGKSQGGELSAHLVRAVASHNLHLQFHDVLHVGLDFGTPKAVCQTAVNGIGKDCRHAGGAKFFVPHLFDAQLTFVPVGVMIRLAVAASRCCCTRILRFVANVAVKVGVTVVRDEFSRLLKGLQQTHAIRIFDANETFVHLVQSS